MKTTMKLFAAGVLALAAGCATRSALVMPGGAEVVSGFSQDDVDYAVGQAVYSILSQDRIKVPEGANRAILAIENVVNDTTSVGSQADILAENIGQSLRELLTDSGKVVVYNKSVAQYAAVQVQPQYVLYGRLGQRNLRKDNGDFYKEFSLNLQLVEVATGLEFWQKRIPIRKVVDKTNLMN
ncbi:MAG: hypothetical protein IJ802_04565 [Kiritimatiellae bacterium]|nr:hypothetical protein [Kiritimatiellia bacterium]